VFRLVIPALHVTFFAMFFSGLCPLYPYCIDFKIQWFMASIDATKRGVYVK